MSLPCLVISGVPQGSVLGPLLFLILLCDIDHQIVGSLVKSFADDTRIMKSISSTSDIEVLQKDLKTIYTWADTNNLCFHDSKCQLIQYGKNENLKLLGNYSTNTQNCIEACESVCDLGVKMTNDASNQQAKQCPGFVVPIDQDQQQLC